MATEWISPTWRMPNDKNQSKFESYSLDFDGTQHINSNLTKSGTIAVSCWFYTDDASTQMAFFGAGTTNPYQIRNFGLQNGEYVVGVYTKDLTPNMRGIRYDTTAGSASYTTGEWTHFVGVIEQVTSTNANYYLYENGVLKVQTNDGYREQNTYPFFLGSMNNFGTASQLFDGKIDQLAVFDYVPSQDQVNYLYNSGTPQNPMAISGQPPIAYYPLGGSSTGSSSTLTIPNESVPDATVFESDPGFFDLPGSSLAPILSGISNFTLSLWYKQDAVSNRFLFDIKDGTNRMALQLVNASTNYFYFNSAFNAYSAVDTPINQWNNVVFVFDGSQANVDRIKLYVNGSRITASITGTIDATLGTFGASTLANLAAASTGGSLYALNGEIANTQMWTTSLDATDVTTIYNNGIPLLSGTQPQAANLRAWYPMNVDNANWLGSDWQIADATSAYPQSFEFDGSSDEIIVSNDSALQIDGDITISAWIYAESDTGRIVSKRGGGGTNYDFYIESRYLRLYDGGTGPFSTGRITLNQWTHILISVTSGTGTYYIDNVAAGTGTFSISSVSTSQPFFIGGAYTPVLANFDGKMSNVQIWNTGLNASQVETLYNNGSPLTTAIESSNLKAWYKLDNSATFSTNWSVPDASGNGNTGTSSGMTESNLVNNNVSALNGTSDGMTTANLVNSDLTRSIPYSSYSMEFDGTADFIDLGTTTDYDTGDLSASIWVNASSSRTITGYAFSNSGSTSIAGFDVKVKTNEEVNVSRITPTTSCETGWISIGFIDDAWQHLSFTYQESTNTIKLFLNGELKNTTTGTTQTNIASKKLTIGSYKGTLNFWDGKLSNAAIWNSELTQDQIITIYNGGVPNSISSLSPIGWWSLSGDSYYNGTDWICPDLGSGGNNGTSSGMGGSELVGDAPGGSANGTATNMDIPSNLKGDAPNSSSNAFSVNMNSADRVASVPS